MKIVGLITEYNPFHNGHQYHIEEAKRITGADYVVAVMSGNFVQRGAPALIDKYSRTKMALACGADIVFELPVCYATASAEFFAFGAVSLFDKLGIVDVICFGSECGNVQILTSIAKILVEEPTEYGNTLNALMKTGKAFPAARMEAIKTIAPHIPDSVLSSPNNILGIEYIKALLRLNSSIKPVTITREIADYHDETLTAHTSNTISSATAIRKVLREDNNLSSLDYHVPDPVYRILQDEYSKTFPIYEDDYSLLLNYKLMQESYQSLTSYTDVSTDLANRILGINTLGSSFSQLAQTIKSRQWTLTRINRVLIHILLNLYSEDFEAYKQAGYTQYARILGIKKASSHLLRQIVKNERIPVITKMADATNLLSDTGLTMLNEDVFSSHLYNQIVFHKYGIALKNEYIRGIVLF